MDPVRDTIRSARLAACLALPVLVLLPAMLVAVPASGQDRGRAADPVRPTFRTARAPGGRIDLDRPVWRARYGSAPTATRVPAAADAMDLVDHLGGVFGQPVTRASLQVERDAQTGPVRHVRYRQVVNGVPVLDRAVSTSIDRDGRVVFAVNGFDYAVADRPPDTRPVVGQAAAREAARRALDGWGGRLGEAELVVIPGDTARLAWVMYAWPDGTPSEWRVLIDAADGRLINVHDQTVNKSGRSRTPGPDAGMPELIDGLASTIGPSAATAPGAEPAPLAASTGTVTPVDGRGAVFDPDPLATAGVSYGFPYTDQDDADVDELNMERIPIALPEITRGNDGLHRLDGPYVTIVGENASGTTVYTPPAEPTRDAFSYRRSHDGFEAVSSYFHIDLSQRHVQSLGLFDLQTSPLPVNPAGTVADESGWIAQLRYLFFGTGGVDDGEDAFVIWHEYAHALLEAGSPGLRTDAEGRALHEGWSDYWAASYQKALIDAGAMVRTDWQTAFRWDAGDGVIWSGRTLDHTGHYPESTCSDDPNPGSCSPHNDGRLWATVLMDIHQVLGRTVTDRLNLLSHRYLSPPVTFADAAHAVVQADVDYYGGAHVDVLVGHFAPRGLVDANDFWPTAQHDPLPWSETPGADLPIGVTTVGIAAPIEEVAAMVRVGSGTESPVLLQSGDGSTWTGSIQAPATPDTVYYWIRVRDALNRVVTLPEGAPLESYSFFVGPDNTPPDMVHDPLTDVAVATWPPGVIATVTDGLGVSSVRVDFDIRHADGTPSDAGTFELVPGSGSEWWYPFPVPVGSVRHGSTVRYAIRARDGSVAANETRNPSSGWHTFTVVGIGVLRLFVADGSQGDVMVSGDWSAGEPRYGVLDSPLAGPVWATNPEGPYAATTSRSRLELPALDLSGIQEAFLVFRHWYDAEHDGTAEPGVASGEALWDGGNVKVSVDGGTFWSILTPEGGYTGRIISGASNELAGEDAFGGHSFGWRREIVALPTMGDVRLVFEFGTDDENTRISDGFAGWYLDEVAVTTERPDDVTAPFVVEAPDPVSVWPADGTFPRLAVQVADDSGVAGVILEYEWEHAEGTQTGTFRLPMAPDDITRFEAALDVGRTPMPDDRIRFRFRVIDVAGNETLYPAASQDALAIHVMSLAVQDLLESARASGGWERRIAEWTVENAEGSLLLGPVHVSANATRATIQLNHRYRFGAGQGGLARVSIDDGATWTPIAPDSGYPGTIDGQPVWDGNQSVTRVDHFDLVRFAGQSVQVRIDVVGGAGNPSSFWTVELVEAVLQTVDPGLEPPDRTTLHANFPDPFTGTTNISATLPEAADVTLAVYDVLGRRVSLLLSGPQSPGLLVLTYDASGLAPGMYILRLDIEGRTWAEPMIRAR